MAITVSRIKNQKNYNLKVSPEAEGFRSIFGTLKIGFVFQLFTFMTRIDRYILFNFFKTLMLWYICFVGLYIVFDLFSNMDSVLSAGRENGNIVFAIGRYYFFKTFQFFDILVSLLIMTSAMITLSTMIRHNELIPLLASGISQLRIVAPIIGAAILVTLLAMACRELLLPRYLNDLLVNNPGEAGRDNGTAIEGMTDKKTGIQLHADKGFWEIRTISKPDFVMPAGLNAYGRAIKAETAQYLPAANNHEAGYLLKNVSEPKELLQSDSLRQGETPVVITPKDASDWLSPTDCFVVSGITFNQIAGGRAWQQYASVYELVQGVRNPSLELGVNVLAVIHSRVTQPFLDFTLLLLGLPIIMSKSDRNVFKAMGIGALLILAFLAFQLMCRNIGISYQQPAFGAWLPLILFVPIAACLFYDMIR